MLTDHHRDRHADLLEAVMDRRSVGQQAERCGDRVSRHRSGLPDGRPVPGVVEGVGRVERDATDARPSSGHGSSAGDAGAPPASSGRSMRHASCRSSTRAVRVSAMGVPADIGFVDILVNKCMPSLVMIGSAAGSGMAVASLLSSHELIPVPFKVVYQDHVAHRHDVVGAVHKALAHERVQEDRNYFEIAVDDAIRAVRNASTARLTEQGWMLRHEHARGEPGDPPHRIIVCPECGTGWYEQTDGGKVRKDAPPSPRSSEVRTTRSGAGRRWAVTTLWSWGVAVWMACGGRFLTAGQRGSPCRLVPGIGGLTGRALRRALDLVALHDPAPESVWGGPDLSPSLIRPDPRELGT